MNSHALCYFLIFMNLQVSSPDKSALILWKLSTSSVFGQIVQLFLKSNNDFVAGKDIPNWNSDIDDIINTFAKSCKESNWPYDVILGNLKLQLLILFRSKR